MLKLFPKWLQFQIGEVLAERQTKLVAHKIFVRNALFKLRFTSYDFVR